MSVASAVADAGAVAGAVVGAVAGAGAVALLGVDGAGGKPDLSPLLQRELTSCDAAGELGGERVGVVRGVKGVE
jgi:hypothetical protein